MELKSAVLKALEDNRGQYISGSALAARLFVSRNAVWKAVKALEEEGHQIQAVTNKGYCLLPESDILSAAAIEKHLGDRAGTFKIEVVKQTTSTNASLKEKASDGAPEGAVLASCEQTSGRGRQGRSFYSPGDTGVYFSLLLRPRLSAMDAALITAAAAVAACEAIEAVAGKQASIKWVNDLFVGGKKVCGILTEGAFDMESGGLDYVVVGIGINVALPSGGFPEDLRDVAGALYEGAAPSGVKARLIAEVLKRLWQYYEKLGDKPFLTPYKKRSFLIGQDVDVLAGDKTRKACAIDIDDDCRLIVRYDDGSIEALSSGEVRVRPRRAPCGTDNK
ncbi:biotin--[acetyl-CoA-carboxylase] ligase [Oscillospiraceae bacterium CM]|nr:biotin--[acetyl-CoA-carboxylase] ligase [Oscillospiraceae bacterium CM]